MSPAKYGQHFLIDSSAIQRIIASMDLKPGDRVLEVGPGKGALTQELAKHCGKLIVVEIDPELAARLQEKFKARPEIQVLTQDILDFNFSNYQNFKVVGNLPYSITSPLLRKMSDWTGWNEAHFMVQKEVGDRLCAKPGKKAYGALTVGISLVAETFPVFDLPPESFRPAPKIFSSVIRLVRRLEPLTPNVPQVQRVIQAAFQQRRKTILNSLSHGLNMDKGLVGDVLNNLKLAPTLRAENLEPQTFVELAAKLLG